MTGLLRKFYSPNSLYLLALLFSANVYNTTTIHSIQYVNSEALLIPQLHLVSPTVRISC
jgi:hypothetical protein